METYQNFIQYSLRKNKINPKNKNNLQIFKNYYTIQNFFKNLENQYINKQ